VSAVYPASGTARSRFDEVIAMSYEPATRRPLQNEAVEVATTAVNPQHPPRKTEPAPDVNGFAARMNRRLKRAAKQAFRLMGED
jgi:hypothetical protein